MVFLAIQKKDTSVKSNKHIKSEGHEKLSSLQLEHISKSFSGIRALNDVSLEIKNEIHAIVGKNGAGKTTLVNILIGALRPDRGTIKINGREVSFRNPRDAKKHRIAMVFQELALFPNLSIMENLLMVNHFPSYPWKLINWKEARKYAAGCLERVNLSRDPGIQLGKLSLAEQQMVEIAKAIQFDPSLLILDEPTSALSLKEQEIFYKTVKDLKKHISAMIFITHNIREVVELADRVTIMRDGNKVFTKEVKNTTEDEMVEAIVGKKSGKVETNDSGRAVKKIDYQKEPLLSVQSLSLKRDFRDISFNLHYGEILGIVGLEGCGKSRLAASLFGTEPYLEGKIELEGKPMYLRSPRQAVRQRLGFVPRDRKEEGLIHGMSMSGNICLAALKRISRGGFLHRGKENELCCSLIEYMDINPPVVKMSAESFSGGNQQKIILGRWLAANIRVLILDEPTRGIDVGSKRMIYDLLKDLASKGLGIIVVSSEFKEVHNEIDRLLVMSKGEIIGEMNPREYKWEDVLALALKGKK